MEGVGARLGRTSTRFAPTPTFTGPVRKWTKRWVPLPTPSGSTAKNSSNPRTTTSVTNKGNGDSHLVLYKWTPISSSQPSEAVAAGSDATPKRRFRYVPVSANGEKMQDTAENSNSEAGSSPAATDASNGKSNMDDVLMEEAQASNLDLNLS